MLIKLTLNAFCIGLHFDCMYMERMYVGVSIMLLIYLPRIFYRQDDKFMVFLLPALGDGGG